MDKDKLFTEYNNLQVIDSMDLKESKNGYKTFTSEFMFSNNSLEVTNIIASIIYYS